MPPPLAAAAAQNTAVSMKSDSANVNLLHYDYILNRARCCLPTWVRSSQLLQPPRRRRRRAMRRAQPAALRATSPPAAPAARNACVCARARTRTRATGLWSSILFYFFLNFYDHLLFSKFIYSKKRYNVFVIIRPCYLRFTYLLYLLDILLSGLFEI